MRQRIYQLKINNSDPLIAGDQTAADRSFPPVALTALTERIRLLAELQPE